MNIQSKHPFTRNRLTLNDLITYIEKNKSFINQTKYGVFEKDHFKMADVKIEPLEYKDTGILQYLPKNLDAIFSTYEFKRYGVISNVNVPKNVDISLISSILYCICQDFHKKSEKEQIDFTQTFIRKLYKECKEHYDNYNYKELGWSMKEFRNNVKNFKQGKDLLRYINDFLHINLFMLDIENDTLIYTGKMPYIKYKKNIFVIKYDDHYEPIDTKLVEQYTKQNTSIIKKILNSKFLVDCLNSDFTNLIDDTDIIFKAGLEDHLEFCKYVSQECADAINKLDEDSGDDSEDIEDSEDDNESNISDDMNAFEETKDNLEKQYDIFDGVTDAPLDISDEDSDSDDSDINEFDDGNNRDNGDNGNNKDKNNKKNKKIFKKVKFSSLTCSDKDKSNADSDDNSDSDNDEVPAIHVTSRYLLKELQEFAKARKIKTTYMKNGSEKNKTKAILIKDINSWRPAK